MGHAPPMKLYWYAGVPTIPTELLKPPESIAPPAFREAVNRTGATVEVTMRDPVAVAGNWLRIEAGTVNVLWPAVVIQMNADELVTVVLPVPVEVEEPPVMSTKSAALAPVQSDR